MDAGLLVWLICLIPIIITGIFYMYKPHEFVWWELILVIVVSVGITFGTKLLTQHMAVQHEEAWGSTAVEIYESEPWNEWIHQTCETCTTDSDGNESCTTYDCSYREHYSPRWYGVTNIGESFDMSEHEYDSILNVWGGSRSIDRTRTNDCSSCDARGSSGTKFANTTVGTKSYVYKSNWNGAENTRIAYSSRHKYENRIQASDQTVFNIQVITPEEADSLGLFQYKYPSRSTGLSYPTILSQVPLPDSVQHKFKKLNGKFGPTNRVRLWVLVYNNAPSVVGAHQENYWVRGNFNEFVICVSVDDVNIVQWSHVFSWTLTSSLPPETRNAVTEIGVLDKQGWDRLYKWLDGNLGRYEKRSHDEFSYITVHPPTWAIWLNVILTILVSIGLNMWSIMNDENDRPGLYRRRY